MIRLSKFLLHFVLLINLNQLVIGQSNNIPSINAPEYIPHSPSVSALGQYGMIPISTNTGIPNIDIPLFTVQSGSLSLPVSISYHGAGIKAADRPSEIGIGWALNAGGAIARIIQGVKDEKKQYDENLTGNGFYNIIFPDTEDPVLYDREQAFFGEISDSRESAKADGIPDLFVYNFNGKAGKFLLKNKFVEGLPPEFMTIPYAPIKIEHDDNFKEFKITDETGTAYQFGGTVLDAAIDYTRNVSLNEPFYDKATGFHLTSIKSANTIDEISISYVRKITYSDLPKASTIRQHIEYLTGGEHSSYSVDTHRDYDQMEVDGWQVSEILFKNGKLIFDYPGENATNLAAVTVMSKTGNDYIPIKKFKFYQTGFFLDSIQEIGYKNGVENPLPAYIFSYFRTDLVHFENNGINRLKAQDYWGYFNGKIDNENMLMVKPPDPAVQTTAEVVPDLEKRKPDELYMKAGSIETITYPTGGTTKFSFEPNYAIETHTFYRNDTTYNNITASIVMGPVGYIQSAQMTATGLITQQLPTAPITYYNSKLEVQGNLLCSSGPNCIQNSTSFEVRDISNGGNTLVIGGTLNELESGTSTSQQKLLYLSLQEGHIYEITFPYGFNLSTGQQYKFNVRATLTAVRPTITYDVPYNVTGPVYFGGLRIKKIESKDLIANKTLIKEYKYPGYYYNSSLFNGDYKSLCLQNYVSEWWDFRDGQLPALCEKYLTDRYYLEHYPVPLEAASGSSVSYNEVEEYQSDGGTNYLGKTVYQYNTATDILSMRYIPFFKIDREYERGLLKEKQVYKYDAGNYTLINKLHNYYVNLDELLGIYADTSKFYVVCPLVNLPTDDPTQMLLFGATAWGGGYLTNSYYYRHYNSYRWEKLYYTSPKIVLSASTNYTYSDETLIDSIYYNYSSAVLALPESADHFNSTGSVKRSATKRVADFNLPGCPDNALTNLKQSLAGIKLSYYALLSALKERFDNYSTFVGRDVDTIPGVIPCGPRYPDSIRAYQNIYKDIRHSYLLATNANSPLLSSYYSDLAAYQNCLSSYYTSATGAQKAIMKLQQQHNLVPATVESKFQGATLLSTQINNFKLLDADQVVPANIYYAPHNQVPEPKVEFNQYDVYGNVQEQQKTDNVKEVYLWGYNGTYPVAKLVNTTYDIAKTYIAQSVLDAPSDDGYLRNHLDNLRNIPGALVTTYTYSPLVGMTSETDPNGKTTYYEYDGFNRLTLIKDQDGNILKSYDYKYQQPQ